jgi:hypothetical protein
LNQKRANPQPGPDYTLRAVTELRCLTALIAAALFWASPADGGLRAQTTDRAQPADRTVEAGVRETLQQYSDALESLDAEAVKKHQPSIDVESLKKAFREMRALDVAIEDIRVLTAEGPVARVRCRVTQTLTPRAGGKRTTTVARLVRLRKQGSSWVIDSFER